jgi:hypothetical protein
MTTSPARTAVIYVQELPDGSWIGNASAGRRTLTDGGMEAETVVRHLAGYLADMPDAERPQTVKLTSIPQAGERDERESDLASLLS